MLFTIQRLWCHPLKVRPVRPAWLGFCTTPRAFAVSSPGRTASSPYTITDIQLPYRYILRLHPAGSGIKICLAIAWSPCYYEFMIQSFQERRNKRYFQRQEHQKYPKDLPPVFMEDLFKKTGSNWLCPVFGRAQNSTWQQSWSVIRG